MARDTPQTGSDQRVTDSGEEIGNEDADRNRAVSRRLFLRTTTAGAGIAAGVGAASGVGAAQTEEDGEEEEADDEEGATANNQDLDGVVRELREIRYVLEDIRDTLQQQAMSD